MNAFAYGDGFLLPESAEDRLLRALIDGLQTQTISEEVRKETRQISFSEFVREAWHVVEPNKTFLYNWHIDAIGVFLDKIEAGDVTRAVINLPPRHMKSLLVSVFWPCWLWTRRPGTRFLFGSYSSTLSKKHNVDRRAIIESVWYQSHWGHIVKLLHDTNRQDEFANTARGHMIATSVDGSSTGKGADIVVIDDPHDPEEAESDARREHAVRWFDRTIGNRLDDQTAKIIVVMQRIHEHDVAGHAINDLGYVRFKVPAIEEGGSDKEPQQVYEMPGGRLVTRKIGSVLWPKRFGRAFIEERRVAQGDASFGGQYQQEPTGKAGTTFKPDDFRIWEGVRPGAHEYERDVVARVRQWDVAATADGGDWSVGTRMALLRDRRIVIEDVIRAQMGPDDVDRAIRLAAQQDKALCDAYGIPYAVREEQEPGSSGKTVVFVRATSLHEYDYRGIPSDKNKVTRAQPYASGVRMGLVYLIEAGWNKQWKEEHRLFPRGKHDDQVDTGSGGYNHLAVIKVGGKVQVGVGT